MSHIVGETFSLCPVCLERLPAQYIEEGDTVYFSKSCPRHGAFRTKVWQGPLPLRQWLQPPDNVPPPLRQSAERLGCPYDCGMCPAHRQAACCVVVEVTERCNLRCPVCFAAAGEGEAAADPSPEQLAARFAALHQGSPGRPYNIQLSGGEPLLREDIAQIVALAKRAGFPYVQINSNGLRLAEDAALARRLKEAGLDCVFLQFDGMNGQAYHALRGQDLLQQKMLALDHCRTAALPVVLLMTVLADNLPQVGKVVDFALDNMPAVRGVHLQPAAFLGRIPRQPRDEDRVTLGELLWQIEQQSRFRLAGKDFVPLRSGHSLCSFHGNFIVADDGAILPLSTADAQACCPCKQDSIQRARAYVARRWGGAKISEGEEEFFVRHADRHGFSLTAMAFQDVWNIDTERLCRCRLQVAAADGRLIPLCAYHCTNCAGERLYARA